MTTMRRILVGTIAASTLLASTTDAARRSRTPCVVDGRFLLPQGEGTPPPMPLEGQVHEERRRREGPVALLSRGVETPRRPPRGAERRDVDRPPERTREAEAHHRAPLPLW
jgi:hypothetical protein